MNSLKFLNGNRRLRENIIAMFSKVAPALKVAVLTTLLLACPVLPGGGNNPNPNQRAPIVGTDAADTLTGTDSADTIEGRGGNDTINAGAGNDTINGGSGDDTIDGGEGEDTAVYQSDTAGTFTFRVLSDGAIELSGGDTFGTDTLRGIEHITLTNGDDTLTFDLPKSNSALPAIPQINGGEGSDTITLADHPSTGTHLPAVAHRGFEIINGGTGPDTIEGSSEAETINGGAGEDTITLGGGADAVVFSQGRNIITDFDLETDRVMIPETHELYNWDVSRSAFSGLQLGYRLGGISYNLVLKGISSISNLQEKHFLNLQLPTVSLTVNQTAPIAEAGGSTTFTVKISPVPPSTTSTSTNNIQTTRIDVNLNTTLSSSEGSWDTPPPNSLTLSVATSSMSFTYTSAADDMDANDGEVTVSIEPDQRYKLLEGSASATVRITDDDTPTVSVSVNPGTAIAEDGGMATFTVKAVPPPARGTTLDVMLASPSISGAEGNWTTAPSTNVMLDSDNPSVSFTYTSSADDSDYNDGKVSLTVLPGSGYDLGTSTATATIDDDETLPEGYSVVSIVAVADPNPIAENGGSAIFVIVADEGPPAGTTLTIPLTPMVKFAKGFWTRGSDTTPLTSLPSEVELTNTLKQVSFSFTSQEDDDDSTDGSVELSIGAGTGYVFGSTRTAKITITDDDEPEVSLTMNRTMPIAEADGTVTFTIEASPAPPAGMTINVALSRTDGGVFAGTWDKEPGATVMLSSSSPRKTFTFSSAPDDNDANDGSIALTLSSPAANAGYTLGSSTTASINITDDDDTVVSITAKPITPVDANGNIAEDGGTAIFTISAKPAPPIGTTIMVPLLHSSSGFQGFSISPVITDFSNIVLMLSSDNPVARYTFRSEPDDKDSVDGVLTFALKEPIANAGYTLSDTASSATVRIKDDDVPIVSLTLEPSSPITEDGGTATFTIKAVLPKAGAGPITLAPISIPLSTAVSGTAGSWDTEPPQVLRFSGTMASVTYTFTPSNDADTDDGSIKLSLQAGEGYTLDSENSSAEGIVFDDDKVFPPVFYHRPLGSTMDSDWVEIPYNSTLTLNYKVEISARSATDMATIYYELGDGTAPADPSTKVLTTLTFDSTGTKIIKAEARKAGLANSSISTLTLRLEPISLLVEWGQQSNPSTNYGTENFFTRGIISNLVVRTIPSIPSGPKTGDSPTIYFEASTDITATIPNPSTMSSVLQSNTVLDLNTTHYHRIKYIVSAEGYFDSEIVTRTFTIVDSDEDGVPNRNDLDDNNNGAFDIQYLDDLLEMNKKPAEAAWYGFPKTKPNWCKDSAIELNAGTEFSGFFCGFEMSYGMNFYHRQYYRDESNREKWCPSPTPTTYDANAVGSCTGTTTEAGFPGIGSEEAPFTSYFFGRNEDIVNLYMRNLGETNSPKAMGLFNYASGAQIKGIRVKNAKIYGSAKGGEGIGALVGKLGASTLSDGSKNFGIIVSSQASGTVTSGGDDGTPDSVGALIGSIVDGHVIDSSSASIVQAESGTKPKLGGLVGSLSNGQIIGSHSASTISAKTGTNTPRMGGLVGELVSNKSRIYGSFSQSDALWEGGTGHGLRAGGLVGQVNQAIEELHIYASFANGVLQGGSDALGSNEPDILGGIIGVLEAAPNSARSINIDLSYAYMRRTNADTGGSLVGANINTANPSQISMATNTNSYGFGPDGAIDKTTNTAGDATDNVDKITKLWQGISTTDTSLNAPDAWHKGPWALIPSDGASPEMPRANAIPLPRIADYDGPGTSKNTDYCALFSIGAKYTLLYNNATRIDGTNPITVACSVLSGDTFSEDGSIVGYFDWKHRIPRNLSVSTGN